MYDLTKRILEKVYDAFEIKFRTQYIEEEILTITFIKLRNLILQFVKHWKTLRCVALARDHRSHLILQMRDLILQFFVFLFKIISFFFNRSEFIAYYFVFFFNFF